MKKCKITVLKRNFDEELAKEYGVEGLTPCPMLKEGQVFYAHHGTDAVELTRHHQHSRQDHQYPADLCRITYHVAVFFEKRKKRRGKHPCQKKRNTESERIDADQ